MSQWTLKLRPLPSDVPEIIRLRKALKALKRFYGFQLIDLLENEHGNKNNNDHLPPSEVSEVPKHPAEDVQVLPRR